MKPILTALFCIAMVFTNAACVSTHMKKFIGKDVRYISLDSGQPENVVDLPDGQRAFQYRWGGGTVYVPKTTTTDGQIQLVGNSAYYSEKRLESGGFLVQNQGCLITYIAKWDAQKNGWIVVDISYPKQLVC